MARVPYRHIEAPGKVYIDGTLAFTKGDPIPLQTADERNIPYEEGDVHEGLEPRSLDGFTDAVIVLDPADRPATDDASTDSATSTDAGGTSAPAGGPRPFASTEGATA